MSVPAYQPNKRPAESVCAEPGDVPKVEDLERTIEPLEPRAKKLKGEFEKNAAPKVGMINNLGYSPKCLPGFPPSPRRDHPLPSLIP